MLRTLFYIGDTDKFEYIAASESGRLAIRTQNPFANLSEVQDLEKVLKAKLDAADPKPEGLAELIEQIHQYNETVTSYERVRYVATMTPQLTQMIRQFCRDSDAGVIMRAHQGQNTILNMDLKVVKVEKDGE